MTYASLIRNDARMLGFGGLHALCSGFGQTYALSLFVPNLQDTFDLSKVEIGSVFSVATLISAASLPYLAAQFDRMRLRTYCLLAAAGMALGCALLGISTSLVALTLALALLRLFGHGVMPHIFWSAMACNFSSNRGKAMAIASLGHPAAQALVPSLIIGGVATLGWRGTAYSAVAFYAVVYPALAVLLSGGAKRPNEVARRSVPSDAARLELTPPSDKRVFRRVYAWLFVPAMVAPPFLSNALFYYQTSLADYQRWNVAWLSTSFIGFAIGGTVFSFIVGPAIDRYKAINLFPYDIIPMALGVGLIGLTRNPWAAPAYLFLSGITLSAGASIKTAVIAEAFGVEHFGRVRGVFATLTQIAIASGPPLLGALLDAGFQFRTILTVAAATMLLATISGVAGTQLVHSHRT